jgi:hypothetical protein
MRIEKTARTLRSFAHLDVKAEHRREEFTVL